MVTKCVRCGKKLSFFSSFNSNLCKDCTKQVKAEEEGAKLEELKQAEKKNQIEKTKQLEKINQIEKIKREILRTKNINEQQIEILINHEKSDIINLYSTLFEEFESDGELEKNELETLQELKESLNLTHEEVNFEQRVLPYHYVYMIKNESKLPQVTLRYGAGVSKPIIKKNEEIHFSMPVILKEMKSVNMGYVGGSSGVSIRVMKGVSYRVGAYKGHVKKEDKLVQTSIGYLMITNQRVLLHPFPGHKPISIPLNKILSYNCFDNGVEIYKDGREKGYFFETENSSAPEVIGMCLGFLCESV